MCAKQHPKRVLVAEDIGHQCPKDKLLWKLLLKSGLTGFLRLQPSFSHFPRLRGLSKLGSTSRTTGVKWYQHTSDSFPSKSRTPFKNLCWFLILSISTQIFLIFLLNFHIDALPICTAHPSFVGSISFLATQETGATGGAANVQQCQRLPWTELGNSRVFIFDLTKIIQKLMSNQQKHIFDLHDTQIHRDVFS